MNLPYWNECLGGICLFHFSASLSNYATLHTVILRTLSPIGFTNCSSDLLLAYHKLTQLDPLQASNAMAFGKAHGRCRNQMVSISDDMV